MATTISLSPVVGTIGAARTERRLKNRPSSLVPRAEFRLESNHRFPESAASLLDATFLIDSDLDAWIDDDDDVAMAAVTVAELQVGVELASRQHRTRRSTLVQAVIEAVPVLPYGLDTALVRAELLADTRRALHSTPDRPPTGFGHPQGSRLALGT
jgi:glycosyltransferase A (GT-A) superfamily protein (DUF2064 family)